MASSIKTQLLLFFTNPVLLACILSWFTAQFIKTVIQLFYGHIHSLPELFEYMFWRTGGLPSSHSALVSCVCTSIAFRDGLSSDLFMLAMCFALVTVRDALGVRRANGIQARRINEIGKILDEKKVMEYKPMKEVQGHTPMEVFIGCLLGFFIGLAFSVL